MMPEQPVPPPPPGLHPRVIKEMADTLRGLAEGWDNYSRDYYYDNRHTHEQGIGYVAGYEDGLQQAATLLRAFVEGMEK